MQLGNRRQRGNVDDRRRGGMGMRTGIGASGILVVVVVLVLRMCGVNTDGVENVAGSLLGTGQEQSYTPTAEDEAHATFAKTILAGTEDVWTDIFAHNGLTYEPPRMVLFSQATTSGCGSASSATGPFYCPVDKTVYIDLSFFNEMQGGLNAGGDFAYAYVIAHEVGHHVQNLFGVLDEVHQAQQRAGKVEANHLSVRLELQADFYAGVWAKYDNEKFHSLEEGDIEEGLNAATQIGDDRLQMQSQGYTVPDAFNHGTSAQRTRWLKKGLKRVTLLMEIHSQFHMKTYSVGRCKQRLFFKPGFEEVMY